MLKHGRAGVPMEVMGLMLGEFVDDYTVRVIDVFAMPQSGTVRITRLFGLTYRDLSLMPQVGGGGGFGYWCLGCHLLFPFCRKVLICSSTCTE